MGFLSVLLVNALFFSLILLFIGLFLIFVWLKKTNLSHLVQFSSKEQYFLDHRKQKVPFPPPFDTNKKSQKKGKNSKGGQLQGSSFQKDGVVYLSVIVPAYNEEKRLDAMLTEAIAYLKEREKRDNKFTWEIIIVSDGSTDRTVEVALEWVKKYPSSAIRILDLEVNRGKGGAVKRGMLVGRGQYLLMVDADGATTFSDFEKLEKQLLQIQKNGYGVSVGSRAHLQGQVVAKRSFFRNILMWGFHVVVTLIGGIWSIKDTQCGFKLFTRKSGQILFHNLHLERWAFDVEVLGTALKFKIPVAEVAVKWKEIEGSHLEAEDTRIVSLKMFIDLVRVRFSYLFGLWELPKFDVGN